MVLWLLILATAFGLYRSSSQTENKVHAKFESTWSSTSKTNSRQFQRQRETNRLSTNISQNYQNKRISTDCSAFVTVNCATRSKRVFGYRKKTEEAKNGDRFMRRLEKQRARWPFAIYHGRVLFGLEQGVLCWQEW